MRLTIERMTYGRRALAHDSSGKVVFVSGAIAGDVVEAKITAEEPKFSEATTCRVLEASPDRTTPGCPLSGQCGGCPWDGMTSEAQLRAKRGHLIDCLTHIGTYDLASAEALVDDCVQPSAPWGYRNKIELVPTIVNGKFALGMHAAEQNDVVPVETCALMHPRFKHLVKATSGALAYLNGRHDLVLERVGIRTSERTQEIEIALWTRPGAFPRAQVARVLTDATRATSLVRVLQRGPGAARKVTGVERLAGTGSWTERLGAETMRVSAPSFFQANTAGAEYLVEHVCKHLALDSAKTAFDLYCGAGTFTLPLARRVAHVDAIEAHAYAIRDLRHNLKRAQLTNVNAIGGDVARELPACHADVIVVDPPRAGLARDVIKQLSASRAETIAYISCDPATLARDLARFSAAGVFAPDHITPVDLFPETYHVETVVLMSRKTGKC